MGFLFILKLLIVLFFLAMFIRGSRLVWGVGLLTVTTAFLLDTLTAFFGPESVMGGSRFFVSVMGGALFAGAAIWLWGVLRPLVFTSATPTPTPMRSEHPAAPVAEVWPAVGRKPGETSETVVDRQMLYEQIRHRLGPEDVLDLIFDLQINENDVIMPHQDVSQIVIGLMDLAAQRGQLGELALAVERTLTPLPPEKLPRLEKLHVDSPPTVLRHYLLAHYSLSDLEAMAKRINIDWEQLAGTGKQQKVRELLLYLYRRNRLADLLQLMQSDRQPT